MLTDIHTLAGAYALDAVSDIERAAFHRHVAECPSCAEELAEFRATVVRLTDLTSVAPPPGMKQAVLAAAVRTRQVPPSRVAQRSRSRGWRGWAVGVAAAVVLAVVGGGVGYVVSDRNTRAEHAVVVSQLAAEAQIATVMAASDATSHTQSMTGGAEVTIIESASLNKGVAVLSKMPKVSSSQAYQLWLIYGDKPVSAGVMAGGQTGGAVVLANVRTASNFGVSLEAAGGAKTPSLPLVTSFGI